MIKVEAIQQFTLSKFNEITNIKRKSIDVEGEIFVGDTFECTKDMVDYLTGKNEQGYVVVKVIEVIPEKVVEKKEVKPTITKITKKKTSKK